jgi:hemoglobin
MRGRGARRAGRSLRGALLAAGLAGAALACAAPPWHETTLYQDLGGEQGVVRLVSAFLDRLAGDSRVAPFFVRTNLDRFEEMLREHTCEIADGPCTYSGDSMSDVHRGLGIGDADFTAVVEDLEMAMDDVGLPFRVQSRLLARLTPLHDQIVEGDPCSLFTFPAAKRARCAALQAMRQGSR